ncbi:hypothetical protein NQ315_016188 [Exocentrus adspersus]|uniref:Integrase p58-like C-terminal domain-containing protein n=1 Tax=Exocentrus adspersus TaxID=1586481 RepID=A0AAV8V853_9CUCU|nr:hypothetical protein NQ315_016188 [Exocentrus adspersus]
MGYAPSMLLTEREMKLPIDLIHSRPLTEEDEDRDRTTLPEFVASLEERLKRVREFARNRLLLTRDRMKMRLDVKPGHNVFKEGDAVWLYQPQRKKGLSPRLQRTWEGPYLIVKKVNDLVYRIQMSTKVKPKVVHVERLNPYQGKDPPTWKLLEAVWGERLKQGGSVT